MTMSIGKPRDPFKEQQWRRRLESWQRSGLSVAAFCRRSGVAEQHFYAWRRILAQRDAAQPGFVAVRVEGAPGPDPDGSVEVILGNGRRLRVGPGFDAATLRQAVAALEEVPPC
jgi:hypothetical protein